MDRLTKLASKLYPRWWRQRYGDEFAALLEDARPGPSGTLDILKGALIMQLASPSSWKPLVVCAALGTVIAVAATFLMTPLYASNAAISIRPPQDSAQAKVGTQSIDIVDALNGLSNKVLSRAALLNVIRTSNLYPEERNSMPFEDVLVKMKRDIRISAAPVIVQGRAVPAFELTFQHPDRAVAQKVVNTLVSGFIDENVRGRASGEASQMTLEVLDPASRPADPIFPNRLTIALAGLGAGTLLGGIVALLRRRKRQPA
jgi:uncharacterized protein involved in exopolysaccharide biosynthesis